MKKNLKIFLTIFVILIGGILYCLSHQMGSWRTFMISSSSMEPAIPTGSLILTKKIDTRTLKKNDIVTFIPPTPKREFVTHRIVKIERTKDLTVFQTKGDRNKTADPWRLASGGIVGEVLLTIPYLGYIFSFTQTKLGILLFILIPAVFIITAEIKVMTRLVHHKLQKKINQEKKEDAAAQAKK